VWFPSKVVAVVEVEHDDQEIIQRVAALDIGKAELVCCVRVPGPGRRRLQEVRTFSTMTRSLLMMSDWLAGLGVTRVVMEATSDYWKPPFYLLEGSFETWLVNAKDVKHLPGRPKRDRLDAVWLCKVAERQMLRPIFVPPEPIRMLRDLTRYRVDLIGARTAEKQRVEKLLEDAQIKVSVVASDIFGVSGRAMMTALIADERDPETLADMARGSMRKKTTQLREAFIGRFNDHHAFLLTKMLARIDQLGADIADVEERTSAQIAPFASTVARLDEIPRDRRYRCPGGHRRDRTGHDSLSDPRAPVLVGQVRARDQGVRRPQEGQRRDRPRQPLPGPSPGRGRNLRGQDRHLPR